MEGLQLLSVFLSSPWHFAECQQNSAGMWSWGTEYLPVLQQCESPGMTGMVETGEKFQVRQDVQDWANTWNAGASSERAGLPGGEELCHCRAAAGCE